MQLIRKYYIFMLVMIVGFGSLSVETVFAQNDSIEGIVLEFGVEDNFGIFVNNRLLWDAAIDDFIAQDPEVDQVIINSEILSLSQRIEQQDCFSLESNIVPTTDLSQLVRLDPFLSVDEALDSNNFITGAFEQVTHEDSIWGLPLSFTPHVLWYHTEIFAELGIPEPTNDWTTSEFENAIIMIRLGLRPSYFSNNNGGSYLYQLIAAYGGTPFDFSTTPYTVNVSESTTVEAIRQVLQLAKDGLINYEPIGFYSFNSDTRNNPSLFDESLYANDYRLTGRDDRRSQPPLRVVMFPRGSDNIPVSYKLQVGHISSNTSAPEACYRWLRFLSRRGEILQGMPTQPDIFDEAFSSVEQTEDVLALYHDFNTALQDPNVVIIPNTYRDTYADFGATMINYITENWVNRAFDQVIVDDIELETALNDAKRFIDDFTICINSINPVVNDLSDSEISEELRPILLCAIEVDPSLSDTLGGF